MRVGRIQELHFSKRLHNELHELRVSKLSSAF
jgi:hypothetical protein